MKTLYLDLFSGISGDMFLGALIDLGVDAPALAHELEKLGLTEYHLHIGRQERGHIAGTKFDVHLAQDHGHSEAEHGHHHDSHHDHSHTHEHVHGDTPGRLEAGAPRSDGHDHEHDHGHSHPHRHSHSHSHGEHEHEHEHQHEHGRTFGDIRQLIERSSLSAWVKQKSIAIFQRVARAEGKIHGHPPEKVHFHEVGAIDSIVDIVGACIALEMLGTPRLHASGVVEGTGWVDCAHGRFPVPAPATLEILAARGIAISQCDEPHELVTPTGAALLAELVEGFGPLRGLTPQKVGYGLGARENKTRPNVLRAILGDASTAASPGWETDTIAVLQTNLDDATAELLGGFVEKALAQGALDVFHTPVQMKKNRPGVLLSLLCAEAEADRFCELILRETTAFGVRRHLAERRKLRREFAAVITPFGEVKIKLGRLGDQVVQSAPEFESCKERAQEAGVPLKQVYEAACRAMKL